MRRPCEAGTGTPEFYVFVKDRTTGKEVKEV